MRLILIGLLVLQIAGFWQLLNWPEDTPTSFPLTLQLTITFGWIALFGHAIWRYPQQRSRAFWLVGVFILYSALRVLLFAQTDYDRQRTPFLLLVITLTVCLMLIYWRFRTWRNHQNKEIFTDDR